VGVSGNRDAASTDRRPRRGKGETNQVPLVRAARRLRVDAADVNPQLIDTLQHISGEHVGKIDKAKNLAEAIK